MSHAYSTFVSIKDAELFTLVALPDENGKFPTVIYRNPYVDDTENKDISELVENHLGFAKNWLNHGYAVVLQHCRGRGKSTGYYIPFVDEHDDGKALQSWIRQQSFYNGELFLHGGSYLSAVHLATAPFDDDIKGAVLEVMDCELARATYRNGCLKTALFAVWYTASYKAKHIKNKCFTDDSYRILPFSEYSKTVFGEKSDDFDELLLHPDSSDPFWTTNTERSHYHNAVKSTKTPILLTTGYYDIFEGGVISMWNEMNEDTKSRSALVVCPYDHGLSKGSHPIPIEGAEIGEKFPDYVREWFDSIRSNTASQIPKGKVTYFRLFEDGWKTDGFAAGSKNESVKFGTGIDTYTYNPFDPPKCFKGGLSLNFGGTAYQDPPNSHYGVRSRYSEPFAKNTFVNGKIKVKLKVKSDCEDTAFYVRLMLTKPDGDYGLRDDITTLADFSKDYIPGEWQEIIFELDEHAFMISEGEKLRLDVSSAAFPLFLPHTNYKGLFSEQDRAKPAHNTVDWANSEIILPCEY